MYVRANGLRIQLLLISKGPIGADCTIFATSAGPHTTTHIMEHKRNQPDDIHQHLQPGTKETVFCLNDIDERDSNLPQHKSVI
jgi:hypothetical protein